MSLHIVVIMGPTAVGKTKVAVALAKRLGNAEIIAQVHVPFIHYEFYRH